MKISREQHSAFYLQQIKAHEDSWRRYADTAMNILIQEKRLFIGRIWGIQETHGYVVLRFNEGEAPRIKQPYFLGLVGSEAPPDFLSWRFSYKTFRESAQPRYWNGVKSDIFTVTYWKTERNKSYILVSGFDLGLISLLKEKYLDKGIHPRVVVAETDPPVEYLLKLKQFIDRNEEHPILNIKLDVTEDNWLPKHLDNTENITAEVVEILEEHPATIIQGPPGTGKSFLAAELCDHYLKRGKSVCASALTNKALMEIASKPGLNYALHSKKVYKSNLSSDERKELPQLRMVDSFAPNNGELLLITYYKLAQKHNEIVYNAKRFDLMIIEEASQAYLATIAMFSTLASKLLIIGDHKQLTPIVINLEEARKIFARIESIIYGLQTYVLNNNEIAYRLVKTKRLTRNAASLTGLFYNNSLDSVSELEGKTDFISDYRWLFDENGSVTLALLSSARRGFTEKDLYHFLCVIALELLEKNAEIEISLLTPYIDVESGLYTQFSKLSNQFKNITINTIHKIQGLTCDLTILYLPLSNPQFDLDANLFNVATSRAKRGTLIVTYQHIDLVSSTDLEVKQFISRCKDVSDSFLDKFISQL